MTNRTRLSAFLAIIALSTAAFSAAAPPSESAGPLAPALQSLVDKHLIAGAVALVANGDKILDTEAVGYRSLTTHDPMQTGDLFWIASMTKSITATAFMTLVDEGKVNINDPVEKYLPEFKGQMVVDETNGGKPHLPKHPITIKECLSHTSGLIRASDKKAGRYYSLDKNVAGYGQQPLIREPGTKYEYNNCGISTAGRIIEVISGMPYIDFVQQRIFDPLGMTHSTFWPTDEQAKRLARSARFNADKTGLEDVEMGKTLTPQGIAKFGGGVPVPPEILADFGGGILPDYGHHFAEPAGGLFTTAQDLAPLCQMLLNGGVYHGKRILSEAAVKQMTSDQTTPIPVSPSEAYGQGWAVKLKNDEGPSVGSFGHRGARRTCMWVDPTNHLVMILLIERWDMPGPDGQEVYRTFFRAAEENFASAKR